MKKLLTLTLVMLLAVVLIAGTGRPRGAALAATPLPTPPTLDDMFGAVAEKVPGFGGMFYDENGRLVVYLQDVSQAPEATDAIAAVFGKEAVQDGIAVWQGKFSFLELGGWFAGAHSLLADVKDVNLLDIDEAQNRLVVGVQDQSAVPELAESLAKLGIPAEAYAIEIEEDAIPLSHTLRNTAGNTGGLRIGNGRGFCTMGFSALDETTMRAGFVTNSHCTSAWGEVDGTVFSQVGARIGVEVTDPPLVRRCDGYGGGVIEVRCRRSDAVFALYDDGMRAMGVGYIARTTGQTISAASPVLTVSHTSPPFRIVAQASSTLSGSTVHKMGSTTGWTSGEVTRTCAQVRQAGGPWLSCQIKARAMVRPGDSGSPVFTRLPGDDVVLHGVLWGSNSDGSRMWLSPISAIERELGPLAVCAFPFGC